MDAYDISRDIFNPQKHYTGVRMQQGRVLTDDDWNEDGRIEDEDKRRSRIDIIGPYGSPDNGYKVEGLILNPDGSFDFTIDPGILYLGGLRLHHAKETYQLQYDWLEQPKPAYTAPTANDLANGNRTDLVYLEVWEQGVSAVEDSELFEPGLGGPDTATRVKNMARVRIAAGIDQNSCADAWTQLQQNWTGQGLGKIDAAYQRVTDSTLKVIFPGTGLPQDLCTPQVQGGYLGAENQAIRVQLRKNNTFTWGFDDASPLYRIVVTVVNGVTTIRMLTTPKDPYHWPLSGQVVEILAWSALLPDGEKVAAQEGYIDKVAASYDPNAKTFTITGSLPAGFGANWTAKTGYQPPLQPANSKTPVYYYLRVWNRGTDTSSDAEMSFTPATNPASITLGNTGLAIQLYGTTFLPGDYWIIAARPETPDKVWPWALQLASGIAPMGVRRFFAPLALLQWSLSGGVVSGSVISDCRKPFKPLTAQDCCCTFTIGDGVNSFGDFNSIQAGVMALPGEGGKLCILPGIHHDTVVITGKRNIEICGCGAGAIVVPGRNQKNPNQLAVFNIVSSGNIKLCNLTVINVQGTAVAIYPSGANKQGRVCGVRVECCMLLAAMYAVFSSTGDNNTPGNGNIRISNNQIGQFDVGGKVPAIFTLGDDVLIERNRIVVIPAPDKRNPNFPGGPNDPGGGIYDPCFDSGSFNNSSTTVRGTVTSVASYLCGVTAETAAAGAYTALGGIQIGSTSERVRILQNTIIGGAGTGIAFGHVLSAAVDASGFLPSAGQVSIYNAYTTDFTKDFAVNNFLGSLYDILIAENTILLMGLSGIGVSAFFSLDNIGLLFRVEGLGIYRNVISHCAQQTQALYDYAIQNAMDETIAFGGIVLAAAENPVIRDNRITGNGLDARLPVCGIYIQYGEKVEITHNRILDNGVVQKGNELQRGNRAGIAIAEAVQLLDAKNAHDADVPAFEGIPAANISDNEVDQPAGLALYLVALGQVSVLGNRFTARVVDTTNADYQLASTIFLLDLGISKDLLAWIIELFGSFEQLGRMVNDGSTAAAALLEAYEYLPGGRVMFANNQVSYLISLLNTGGKVMLDAQLIASLDDIAYINNQSEITGFWAKGFPPADITFADTTLLGVSVRSNDNRWQEGLSMVFASLFSGAAVNTCADNQATHPLLAIGPTNRTAIDNNIVLYP
jgi:hypothetical protein